MRILRFLISALLTIAAALAGNWVGDELRYRLTGERSRRFQFVRNSEPEGETVVAINPALSNLLPALLVGVVRQPHLPWAFLAGALISAVIGDQYEEEFTGWLKDLPRSA
jgi:hypothetical protein